MSCASTEGLYKKLLCFFTSHSSLKINDYHNKSLKFVEISKRFQAKWQHKNRMIVPALSISISRKINRNKLKKIPSFLSLLCFIVMFGV